MVAASLKDVWELIVTYNACTVCNALKIQLTLKIRHCF